jgi:putative transposase
MGLGRAFNNLFAKRSKFPKFKKRGREDSFRRPQGFKPDEANLGIWPPKIGRARHRQSRLAEGRATQATASLDAGKRRAGVQAELEAEAPAPVLEPAAGIDLGAADFAALSGGSLVPPINAPKKRL